MESFEITFFCPKNSYSESAVSIIDKLTRPLKLAIGEKILVESFNEENKSFSEVRMSVFELVITESSFRNVLQELFEFVSTVFREFPFWELATGVYELTYYFTENIVDLSKFDEILRRFPILFLKPEQKYDEGIVMFKNSNVKCVFQENAQSLF
jgi:hypothetical protein